MILFYSNVPYRCFNLHVPQVKPTLAGSSIGVTVAYGVDDAIEKAINIISEVVTFDATYCGNLFHGDENLCVSLSSFCGKQGIDDNVLVEVFLEGGSEFTAIVIDVGIDNDAKPVVLLPTEVSQSIYMFFLYLEESNILFLLRHLNCLYCLESMQAILDILSFQYILQNSFA